MKKGNITDFPKQNKTDKINEIRTSKIKGESGTDSTIQLSEDIGGKNKMNIMAEKLFDNEVVGIKAFRSNLTSFVTKALNNFQVVLTGNTAVKGGKTVSLVPTELFEEVLEAYKFNPVVNIDKETGIYEIIVEEIGALAGGETKEEVIEILVDNIVMLTEDYFEKLEFYKGIANMRKMLPYYLRIKHCSTVDELMNVLGLEGIKF